MRAARTGVSQLSDFLTPAEQLAAEICARKARVSYASSGGAPGAERRVAAFFTEDAPAFPIVCVEIRFRERFGSLGHRDLLGALMALGLRREKLGDVFPGEGIAYAMALSDVARYIESELDRAGNMPVTVRIAPQMPEVFAREGERMRVTLPSLRLDAILCGAFRLSRQEAEAAILSGRVSLNYQKELRPDHRAAEGALISARGMGRAKLCEIHGKNAKNRICVTILRY